LLAARSGDDPLGQAFAHAGEYVVESCRLVFAPGIETGGPQACLDGGRVTTVTMLLVVSNGYPSSAKTPA
jgi:hypothetical protein